MQRGQFIEHVRAPGCQIEMNATPVSGRRTTFGEARLREAVDQLHGGMMGKQKLLGEILHRHVFVGPCLYGEHGLILLLGDAGGAAYRFAGGDELAQSEAEAGQSPVLFFVQSVTASTRSPRGSPGVAFYRESAWKSAPADIRHAGTVTTPRTAQARGDVNIPWER
jgi:hypothetical protein